MPLKKLKAAYQKSQAKGRAQVAHRAAGEAAKAEMHGFDWDNPGTHHAGGTYGSVMKSNPNLHPKQFTNDSPPW